MKQLAYAFFVRFILDFRQEDQIVAIGVEEPLSRRCLSVLPCNRHQKLVLSQRSRD